MSGTNPFRRKGNTEQSSSGQPRAFDHSPVSSNPDAHIPPIVTDVPRPPKTKIVKTVRIISPHSADSENQHGMPEGLYDSARNPSFSPPPEATSPVSSNDESPKDPFGADSEGAGSSIEDEGTRLNTLANAGETGKERQLPSGMPANPFKKTLATIEIGSPDTDQKPPTSNSVPIKAQYDVDDFKRLLLTGEKNIPKSSAPSVSFSQPQNGDSSSNTDASSLSRQSIFEPAATVPHESPRTSQETSVSDDERQRLVGTSPPKAGKPKPSAPRPRHGKLVKANAPQTVSFEDPALSYATSDGDVSSHRGDSSLRSPTPKASDKPLPALPSPSTSSTFIIVPATPTSPVNRDRSDSYSESKEAEGNTTSQKRTAPAPPPSRRHSQRRPISVSSQRSLPISEETVEEPMQILSSSPTSSSNAPPPPPPPPRRSNTGRRTSFSSIPASSLATAGTDQLTLDDPQMTPFKSRPPVPPTRSPTLSASKAPHRTSPASGSPSMAPPPPPPPRRRTSSQSSYTPSRLSGNYSTAATERLRSDSGASSISQLPMTSMEPQSEPIDVIADLTALQREVDELRGKMK